MTYEYLISMASRLGKHRILVRANNREEAVFKATCVLMACITQGHVPSDYIDMTDRIGEELLNDLGLSFLSTAYAG